MRVWRTSCSTQRLHAIRALGGKLKCASCQPGVHFRSLTTPELEPSCVNCTENCSNEQCWIQVKGTSDKKEILMSQTVFRNEFEVVKWAALVDKTSLLNNSRHGTDINTGNRTKQALTINWCLFTQEGNISGSLNLKMEVEHWHHSRGGIRASCTTKSHMNLWALDPSSELTCMKMCYVLPKSHMLLSLNNPANVVP